MPVGCAIMTDHLLAYHQELLRLPAIEIEDYLVPQRADTVHQQIPQLQTLLAGYHGEVLLSGPFIDLNPGTSERLIRRATRQRFEEAHSFASAIGAAEIVFLSSFIPIIDLPSYEESWVAQSIAFWRSYLASVDPKITITLGNTFEFNPLLLVRIVEAVDRPNFQLAFDLGHFLVYSQIELPAWMAHIRFYCTTVYVHSNDGRMDSHDAPFTGLLQPEQMEVIAEALPTKTKYIAKMNDKAVIKQSVDWIQQVIARS